MRRTLADRRHRTGRWAGPLIAPDATYPSPVHGLAALAALFADLDPGTDPGTDAQIRADVPIARALT